MAMYLETIQSKTKKIIACYLRISEQDILAQSTLTDLGADSFDRMDIIFQIEKAFRIIIQTDEPDLLYNGQFRYLCNEIEVQINSRRG
jgi:acyl carrier protein